MSADADRIAALEAERDAIMAQAAAMRLDLEEALPYVPEYFREKWRLGESLNGNAGRALLDRLAKAEADVGALLGNIIYVITECARLAGRSDESWLPFIVRQIRNAVPDGPGRALAARVPLLEAVATAARTLVTWKDNLAFGLNKKRVLDALAALDGAK